MFERIKRYYELGIWSEMRVRDAVDKGAITTAQFKELTGKDY